MIDVVEDATVRAEGRQEGHVKWKSGRERERENRRVGRVERKAEQ